MHVERALGDMESALILLGHGSRRGSATDLGMHEVAQRLAARFPSGPPVTLAFFEFLQPDLATAIHDVAGRGVQRIVVAPYFLFAGKEITVEIPAALDRLRAQYADVTIVQAADLGVEERLIEVVVDRIQGALQDAALVQTIVLRLETGGRLGVVVVNRGSKRHYDAGERLEQLAESLRRRLGPEVLVATAQAENSDITVQVAGRTMVDRGVQHLVIAPYLHFPGKVLADNIIPGIEQLRRDYPGVRFALASTLGVDDRIVDICYDRARAALL